MEWILLSPSTHTPTSFQTELCKGSWINKTNDNNNFENTFPTFQQ